MIQRWVSDYSAPRSGASLNTYTVKVYTQCFRWPVSYRIPWWPTAEIHVPVVLITHTAIIKDSNVLQFYFICSDVSCTQHPGTIEDAPPSQRLHAQTPPFVWILMPVQDIYKMNQNETKKGYQPGYPETFLQPMHLHQMHFHAGLRRLEDDRDSAWKFFLWTNFAAETLYNETPDK